MVGAQVERVVREVTVPVAERGCACCDEEMAVIGHETLEFVPAKFILQVERREKLACRNSQCRGDIHTAERACEPPIRHKVGISLLAQLVEGKCEDALPVDRQRDQFKRLGVTFPLNTLYSHWTYVTTLLMPVAMVTLARVLGDDYVRLDDTKLRVLDRQRPRGSYKGCLWCFTSGNRSSPLLDDFESWVDDLQPKCLPKSTLAKALGYAKSQRVFIRRCFSDGRFEIDNGDTERALRRPCIGRNNYLFTGSPEAAKRLAGAYTLVQSCRAVGVQPRAYLIDVIAKLEVDWPLRRIGELVSDQWAVLHGPGALGQQTTE